MGRNVFSFEGGEELTTMGACWFVSYYYYNLIDSNHKNWNTYKISTVANRESVFKRTQKYHNFWLTKIMEMNDDNLNKNSLDLNASQVKEMAEKLLLKINNKEIKPKEKAILIKKTKSPNPEK